jgi:hypothetical protein
VSEVDSILHNLINQLVSVSIPSDTMHRDEHIRNLTPITNVFKDASAPYSPEGTFIVGKLKPKDAGTTTIDDLMKPITCMELYPLYMELEPADFVIRLNKTLYDYLRQQLEQAKANHVPDSDNIWMKPNTEFYNYFQEQGIDVDSVSPILQDIESNDIEIEDVTDALWAVADDMRDRVPDDFSTFRDAYRWWCEHHTHKGKDVTWESLENEYKKANGIKVN